MTTEVQRRYTMVKLLEKTNVERTRKRSFEEVEKDLGQNQVTNYDLKVRNQKVSQGTLKEVQILIADCRAIVYVEYVTWNTQYNLFMRTKYVQYDGHNFLLASGITA